jgi:hypothetical protein
MECSVADHESGVRENKKPGNAAESVADVEAKRHEQPEEKAKRTKHTRVQKREKELYGLVTPVFLPLLDARDTSPKLEKKAPKVSRPEEARIATVPEHATPTGDAEKKQESRKSRREHTDMEGNTAGEVTETPKKKRSSTTKKSALRQHTSSTKSRRKRVSLVIDGQTVLPADTVIEPALTSPSSEATSASNSTASLDEMIDPRLTSQQHIRHTDPGHIHTETTHHSLPLPMSNNIYPITKPLIDAPGSLTLENEALSSPDLTLSPTADPVLESLDDTAATDPQFNTYVGGLRGSGADDVDQAGSYGYPSSLGASYLESYMQSRPLRVRMEAADKAGLGEVEKEKMKAGRREEEEEMRGKGGRSRTGGEDEDVEMEESVPRRGKGVEEDDDFMGEMEDF